MSFQVTCDLLGNSNSFPDFNLFNPSPRRIRKITEPPKICDWREKAMLARQSGWRRERADLYCRLNSEKRRFVTPDLIRNRALRKNHFLQCINLVNAHRLSEGLVVGSHSCFPFTLATVEKQLWAFAAFTLLSC